MNRIPLSTEQLASAREIAKQAGANPQTLAAFDEEMRRASMREKRLACVTKLKTLIAEIEAGTLEPVGFSEHRGAIEGVSPCGSWVTHTPDRDTHYSFTLRRP